MEYSKILQRRARSNADAKLSEYAGWEHVKGEIWPDERWWILQNILAFIKSQQLPENIRGQ